MQEQNPDEPIDEETAIITFDGGARGNPGPAAIGYTIEVDGQVVEGSERIGKATNNEAEYHALIGALEEAHQRGCTVVETKGDSELIVKQVRGEYDVNARNLQSLYQQVQQLIQSFERFEIDHVGREENVDADRLVNQAFSD